MMHFVQDVLQLTSNCAEMLLVNLKHLLFPFNMFMVIYIINLVSFICGDDSEFGNMPVKTKAHEYIVSILCTKISSIQNSNFKLHQ